MGFVEQRKVIYPFSCFTPSIPGLNPPRIQHPFEWQSNPREVLFDPFVCLMDGRREERGSRLLLCSAQTAVQRASVLACYVTHDQMQFTYIL